MTFWEILRWVLPSSFIFSLVLIPAVRYWLGKEYVTTKTFEAHVTAEERAHAQRHEDIAKRIAEVAQATHNALARQDQYAERFATIETKISLFWKTVETSMAQLLHRDDTPDVDRLLEKLPADNLTDEERTRLEEYLCDIEKDPNRPRADRYAAVLLRATLIARFLD